MQKKGGRGREEGKKKGQKGQGGREKERRAEMER